MTVHAAARLAHPIVQPCEKCGNPKGIRHHDDYSKPTEIRWLCHKHHWEFHRLNPHVRAPRVASTRLRLKPKMETVEKTIRNQEWAKRHIRTGETAKAIADDVNAPESTVRRAIRAWRDWARKELIAS